MARIVSGSDPINTQVFPNEDLLNGVAIIANQSRISIIGGRTGTQYDFFGSGFTFNGDQVTGGNITRYAEDDGLSINISSAPYSAVRFQRNLRSNDPSLIPRIILATNDTILGSSGDDRLQSFAGDDSIRGGEGRDTILGASGNDTLFGQNGDDILSSGPGNDSLVGGSGDDTLSGSSGNDILIGQDGQDRLVGGGGNDIIQGDSGDDILIGTSGSDILIGSTGNDLLLGGAGNDVLSGGASADRYRISGQVSSIGTDSFRGFSHDDILEVSRSTFSLETGVGNPILNGDFVKVGSPGVASRQNQELVYDTNTGMLYYNANGAAAGFGNFGGVIASFTNNFDLNASDINVIG